MAHKNDKSEDKLGVVCVYFNPCNYLSRFINFNYFYENIKTNKNIELIVIEQYTDDSKYRINNIHENTHSFHSNEIYWMKEQLINIGFQKLINENFKYICWLDCDIKFKDDDWSIKVINALQENPICQVFRTCIKTNPNGYSSKSYSFSIYSDDQENESIETLLKRQGEPGFGFAYNTNYISDSKLYEYAICGSGDFLNILGYLFEVSDLEKKLKSDRFFRNNSLDFLNHFLSWAYSIKSRVKKIPCVDNTIIVDYHGSIKNRKYVDRETILTRNKFNPIIDLDNQGTLFELKNKKIKQQIKNYFLNRHEDNFIGELKNNKYIKSKLLYIHRKRNKLYSPNHKIEEDIENLNNKQTTNINLFNLIHIPCDKDAMIVSKTNTDLVKTNSDSFDKIIIDKSKQKQKQSIHNKNKNGDAESYLNYIISNYENLNDKLLFTSDSIFKKENSKKFRKDIFKKDENFIYLYDVKKIKTDSNNHFLKTIEKNYKTRDYINKFKESEINFTQWVYLVLGTKLDSKRTSFKSKTFHTHSINDEPLKYSVSNSFLVNKELILQKPKEFYIKIYDRLQLHTWNEEMFYINLSWELIFKC